MFNTIATIILTILLVFHLPIAFFASKELNDYPVWNKNKKIKWLFIVWFLPIIGSVVVQKKIHLECVAQKRLVALCLIQGLVVMVTAAEEMMAVAYKAHKNV